MTNIGKKILLTLSEEDYQTLRSNLPDCMTTTSFVRLIVKKYLASCLLAREVNAEYFLIATDVTAVFVDWGTPQARAIKMIHPDELSRMAFDAGSMGAKVDAACEFARLSGKRAVIGALEDIDKIIHGQAGTIVSTEKAGIEWY